MSKAFAVIGLGAFGRSLCRELAGRGMRVIAMDNQSDLVESVSEEVAQTVLLDATDPEALGDAPLKGVETVIIAIGDNIEASILATALLKGNLSMPTVIARAVSEVHAEVLMKVGADRVMNLEVEQGKQLANELITPDTLRRLTVADDISVAELYAPKSLVKVPLEELKLREKYRINVLLIRRTTTDVDDYGNTVTRQSAHFPQPSTELRANDILVVVGRDHDIERLQGVAETE
ncbi:MAG: potassium channel family protein [Alkalispirochaetaceae bacterium]